MSKKKVEDATTEKEYREALGQIKPLDDEGNIIEPVEPILPEDDEIEEPKTPADELVESMKKQVEEANRREQEAIDRANELLRVNEEISNKYSAAETNSILQHEIGIEREIDALTAEVSIIEAALLQAAEDGNIKDQVELQRKLTRSELKLATAENNREQFLNWKKQMAERPAQPVNKPNEQKLTKHTEEWLNNNPEFNDDPYFRNAALTAQAIAEQRGIKPGTQASIEFVDAELTRRGFKTPPDDNQPQSRQSKSSTAAPVRRDSSSGKPSKEERYKLTAEEVAFCERNGLDKIKYAQGKQYYAQNGY